MTKYFYSAIRKRGTVINGIQYSEGDPLDDVAIILQGSFKEDIESVYDYIQEMPTCKNIKEDKEHDMLEVETTDGGKYDVSSRGEVTLYSVTEQAMDQVAEIMDTPVTVVRCASINDAMVIIQSYADKASFSKDALQDVANHFKVMGSDAVIGVEDFVGMLKTKEEKDTFSALVDYPPKKPAV